MIGCQEEIIAFGCVSNQLEKLGMVESDGVGIGCVMYVELYEYKNKQYYLLGNHCIDMISYPLDCDGNTICDEGDEELCADFWDKADRLGIIGVEKE
ncbi:MAG: hypothetical protein AAGI23_15975 [Bacteroidota bacterium]